MRTTCLYCQCFSTARVCTNITCGLPAEATHVQTHTAKTYEEVLASDVPASFVEPWARSPWCRNICRARSARPCSSSANLVCSDICCWEVHLVTSRSIGALARIWSGACSANLSVMMRFLWCSAVSICSNLFSCDCDLFSKVSCRRLIRVDRSHICVELLDAWKDFAQLWQSPTCGFGPRSSSPSLSV